MSQELDGVEQWIARFSLRTSDRDPFHDSNATNKRLYIKLNKVDSVVTGIMVRKHWGGKAVVEKTLSSMWKLFGTASDIFYKEDYTFCFLSFPTHEEAATALSRLNHDEKISEAAAKIANAEPDLKARKIEKQILGHLFGGALFGGKRASWARAREYSYNESDDHNDHDYVDDCPDFFDREEWNSYCEGRH